MTGQSGFDKRTGAVHTRPMKAITVAILFGVASLTGAYGQVMERTITTPPGAAAKKANAIWQANTHERMIYLFGNTMRIGGPIVDVAGRKQRFRSLNPSAPVQQKKYWEKLAEDPHTGAHQGLALFWLRF